MTDVNSEPMEQWVAAKLNDEGLTFSRMYDMWQHGAVGYKEFRNWLANEYPEFAAVRDTTIDNGIDELARQRRQFPDPSYASQVNTSDPSAAADDQ